MRAGLNLLALLTDGIGAPGGIARYNTDLMRALSASSAVGQVTTLPRHGDSSCEHLDGIFQLAAVPDAKHWALTAAALALGKRSDGIFCGHLNAAPYAALLARLTSRPLWIQVHGIEAWAPRGALFRQALRQARLVSSVSRYTRQRLLSWCDLDPSRVRVLPNTVDALFRPQAPPKSLIDRYALQGRKVIMTMGRLDPRERYKGHDRVIAALPAVLRAHPTTVYMIVGSGEDEARLRAKSVECAVKDAVIFTGEIQADDRGAYLALASVFAMPSTGEGFGIVFLEAAACGLPVIGGDQDGSVDALADGAIGVLVNPENNGHLAEAIVDALNQQTSADPTQSRRFAFKNFARHAHGLVEHAFLDA